MTRFESVEKLSPDELVNITIKGARYIADHGDRMGFDVPDSDMRIWLPAISAIIERVAPAQWPPQSGDVWQDRNGGQWFAYETRDGGTPEIAMMISVAESDRTPRHSLPDKVLREKGPMKLLYSSVTRYPVSDTPA